MPRLLPRALIVGFGALLLVAPPASAARWQDPPGTSTTTTDPPPSSTTTTTRPGGGPSSTTTSTTSTTVPPGDPGAGGDVTGGQVPGGDVVVPPHDYAGDVDHEPSVAIVGDLGSARERLATAEARFAEAGTRVVELHEHLVEVDAQIVTLTDEERQAVKRVEEAQHVLEDRAVNAYMRGNLGDLAATLGADNPNEASVNEEMMESVLAADDAAVDDFRRARREVSAELVDLAAERQHTLADVIEAKHFEKALRLEVVDAHVQLAAFEAGSSIFVTNMVFPVDNPHDYIDSWQYPRSGGRQHQGVDIFAPIGTSLFAVERGVITNVGTNSLGGTKLWLYGESGTTYYYAHLSAFAPGIRNGLVVDSGELVGLVGNTGNARTTPPHLHFEIHPNNGPAVNPTPLLRVVDALDDPDALSATRR